jgi:AcrR family transcriptional regulator
MNDTSQNGKTKKAGKDSKATTKESGKDSSKSKKRDRSASEGRLLKAAEETFSKCGFSAATTRMIALKAKVNESLIGRYFDGKMGLLLGVITHYIKEDEDRAQLPYPAQATVLKELLGFAQYKFEKDCEKNFDIFKIVLSQTMVDAKFNKVIREKVPFFQQPALEARLRKLIVAGPRPDTDVKLLIKELELFMMGNLIVQRIIMGNSEDETHKTMIDFISRHYKDL